MKYEPLTQDQTYSIFVDVVRLYTEKGLVSKQEDWKRFAMNLYKKKLDGRQIRNVVMSAISYAKGRNDGEGKMTLEDVQDVLVWVEDFKTDLAGQMRTWQNTQKLTRLD